MTTSSTPRKPRRTRQPKKTEAARAGSLLDRLIAIGNEIPDEELRRLPRDSAKNLDHYLDGSPKQP